MPEVLKNVVKYFTRNPKKVFLADSVGALMTAVFLFLILTYFSPSIGMPKEALIYLIVVAAIFFVYSMLCFLFLRSDWKPFLMMICVGNLLYCILVIVLLVMNYHELTALGIIYFIGEVLIIGVLISVELKVVRVLSSGRRYI